MKATNAVRYLPAVVGILLLYSCTLVVDLDELENGQCPTGQKVCDSKCVRADDPKFGCANTGCVPCYLPYANAICGTEGACQIASCSGAHSDCNGQASDGCEIDLDHNPKHCGGCLFPECKVENGTPDCKAGRCAIASCTAGFSDCNKDPKDGCEAQTTSCP